MKTKKRPTRKPRNPRAHIGVIVEYENAHRADAEQVATQIETKLGRPAILVPAGVVSVREMAP
jgi:glyceraldehyde-3-phosphate dehydrogenase/erythrose-4-phosphate dehydrogenase